MGSGGIQQGSSSSSMSKLAKDQQKILNQSWDMYVNDIYPQAVEWMKTGGEPLKGSLVDNMMSKQAQGVNESYASAKQGVAQSLAQRGLLGSGSGVEGAAATNLQTGRAKTLSDSYANVLFQDQQRTDQDQVRREQNRMNALGLLIGKSPTPTSSAPMNSSSSNSGVSGGILNIF